jgi:hypothetical protein
MRSECSVPRVRESSDGNFTITTYRGNPNDEEAGWFGTWYVHGLGEEILRRYGLLRDGTTIPMEIFLELCDRRAIWNSKGVYPRQSNRPIPSPDELSSSRQTSGTSRLRERLRATRSGGRGESNAR